MDALEGNKLVSRTQICKESSQLQLTTRKLFDVEKKYQLTIEFYEELSHSTHGFYVSTYLEPDGSNRFAPVRKV